MIIIGKISHSLEFGNYDFCVVDNDTTIDINNECFSSESQTCSRGPGPLTTITSNTILLACQEKYSLDFVISLVNVSNVTILGVQSVSVFNCTGNGGVNIMHSDLIQFYQVEFSHCGTYVPKVYISDYSERTVDLKIAVFIFHSFNITFSGTRVVNSHGSGVILANSEGNFMHSIFSGSFVNSEEKGGEGMRIVLNDYFNDTKFNVLIKNCTFESNSAGAEEDYGHLCNETLLFPSRGGGLGIFLRRTTSVQEVQIIIDDSIFKNNRANWGSGMYVLYCASAWIASIEISNTKFINNVAQRGGGGLDIGFKSYTSSRSEGNNRFICSSCEFNGNKAQFGGGTAIFTDEFVNSNSNSIIFSNSSWYQNEAFYGIAVDLSPRFINTPTQKSLIRITFSNVFFCYNSIRTEGSDPSSTCTKCNQSAYGKGTFLVTGIKVDFKDSVTFLSNFNSAIYATSSILLFHENTVALFKDNKGIYGAAIALIGFSAIQVNSNVTINMFSNSASSRGGAIYHKSINKHDYTFSHSCFIQHAPSDPTVKADTVVFNFSQNIAGNSNDFRDGNSIFTTTLKSCQRYCKVFSDSYVDNLPFGCIGKFYFNEDTSAAIATRPGCMFTNQSQELDTFPGDKLILNFNNTDDLNEEVQAIYHITSSGNITVDASSVYTSVKTAVINGKPGSKGYLTVTNVDFREAAITFEVKLKACPPFFMYSYKENKCICYKEQGRSLSFLFFCDVKHHSSSLVHGYWIGLLKSSEDLIFGYCPIGYCFEGQEENRTHVLPSSLENLDTIICNGSRRTGRLCGKCKSNYTAHFHSFNFKCDSNTTCSYGWLLYIISEIFPLMLLFFIVISFKVSFTSGYLNGFLLFAQVIDTLLNVSHSFVYYQKYSYYLIMAIQILYKLFNLDFFAIDPLSFCLWKGATALDMLAVKFVTVISAFILVFASVVFLNKFTALNKMLQYTKGSSVTHGFSTFLLMVYMQCTKTSFDILRYTNLSLLNNTDFRSVVFYQGNIDRFSNKHAPYATFAIVFLIFISIIPPLLLLVYPLCFKLFAVMKLDKLTPIIWLERLLIKLKPFLDAFQGPFKDEFRFFSGLYFGYRVVLLLATFVPRISQTFVVLQIELVLMMTIHTVCWPYAKRKHNVIDTFIFSILAVVNSLLFLNHVYSRQGNQHQSVVNISSYFIFFLVCCPMLYLCGYIIISSHDFIKRKFSKRITPNGNGRISLDDLGTDRDVGETFDYSEFASSLNNSTHMK